MSVYEQNVEIVKLLLERKDTDVNIKSITKNIFCNKVSNIFYLFNSKNQKYFNIVLYLIFKLHFNIN